MKIAIVYDAGQPYTTGIYCRRALCALGHSVEHYDKKRRVIRPYDLVLKVDDGTNDPFRVMPWHKTAFWAIDTHTDMDRLVRIARRADNLFCAQKNGVGLFQERGFAKALWLPLAAEAEAAGEAPELYDIAFIGGVGTEKRRRIGALAKRLSPRVFFGPAPREEISRVYSRAFIGLNTLLANDINMRTFEITVNGALLLMERVRDNGMEEIFIEGLEYVSYEGEEELGERIRKILADRGRYEPVREAGRARAVREHTYEARMTRLLSCIGG